MATAPESMTKVRLRTAASCAAVGVCVLLLIVTYSLGADTPSQPATRYCGVHCVYAALESLGLSKEATLQELLVPKYIGSSAGSSLAELKAAVEDLGGHSEALTGLSAAGLTESTYPLILNVASEGQLRAYNHWILFLGMEDGQAKIMDPPAACRLVSVSEILRRWNGTALVVSDKPIDRTRVTGPEYESLAVLVTFALGIGLLGRCYRSLVRMDLQWMRRLRRSPSCRMLAEAAALVGTSFAVSMLVHANSNNGFLRNSEAVDKVVRAHLETFLNKLSLDEMRLAVGESRVAVIDARVRRDFDAGHIPGAISLPVDSKDEERQEILLGIAKSQPIVVYCQSNRCYFDDRIGIWLTLEGYTDVSVYPGGWNEWSNHEHK